MKIKELIKELQKYDQEAIVWVWQKSFLGEESGQNRIYRSKLEFVTQSKNNVLKIYLDGE
jgi:hypothetical protein